MEKRAQMKELPKEFLKECIKKGKEMCHSIMIPIGRKVRQALKIEKKRAAAKAKLEASRRSA